MTVQELLDRMKDLAHNGQGDKEVKFAYNYGDHWRTTVAESISTVNECQVKYSDYHGMDRIVEENYYDGDDGDDCEMTPKPKTRTVIILE